jgi:starvation-inducible DNA-binding protein
MFAYDFFEAVFDAGAEQNVPRGFTKACENARCCFTRYCYPGLAEHIGVCREHDENSINNRDDGRRERPQLHSGAVVLIQLLRLNYCLIENHQTRKNLLAAGRCITVRQAPVPAVEMHPANLNEVTHMLQRTSLTTPTDLSEKAVQDISKALLGLLSDVFALYLKTKNFHWHMSGSHFRDYHLMLDDQSVQILAMTDAIAERARKIGGPSLRSIGQISRLQRVADNDAEYVKPLDMLAELLDDNATLTSSMREIHSLCDEANDVATASLLENWIDESEKRSWFLFECGRDV